MTSVPIRIGVIALSRILDDPRVRRQCELLQASGFEVFAIGADDERDENVGWTVVPAPVPNVTNSGSMVLSNPNENCSIPKTPGSVMGRIEKNLPAERPGLDAAKRSMKRAVAAANSVATKILGRSPARFATRLLITAGAQLCRLQPAYADRIFWSWIIGVNDLYDKAKALKCDIWLANDWVTLPIAARLATENGGVYVYDTHEFAIEEYQERWVWRVAQKPIVAALEKKFIKEARLVSAVSSGIADRITEIYRLPRPAITIRNMPSYIEVPFRPTPEVVRVLYHGVVSPGRGLEAAIDGVPSWALDRQFYIRGPGSEGYIASLRERIEKAGLQSRVFLLPPVPMTELVRRAAEFDVGFVALPGHSLNNEFALPNKFFEYAMAGLALCVSRRTEMASLVSEHKTGSTFAEVASEPIATAINELSREQIDRYKRNSLIAARELCWERESAKLVAALTSLVEAG